jgi:hypothetical protein
MRASSEAAYSTSTGPEPWGNVVADGAAVAGGAVVAGAAGAGVVGAAVVADDVDLCNEPQPAATKTAAVTPAMVTRNRRRIRRPPRADSLSMGMACDCSPPVVTG